MKQVIKAYYGSLESIKSDIERFLSIYSHRNPRIDKISISTYVMGYSRTTDAMVVYEMKE